MSVVTRIAPSPTGYLHFGLARTALYSYLYAKQFGGTYLLRIEDTDVARNKEEYEADIDEQLAWLGLMPDKRFRQSDHRARHTECLKQLVDGGHAYVSEEAAKDDPCKQVSVVRFKNPKIQITFTDLIRGEITFDTSELGDFVIARSIDDPLYHIAVVVDDNDESITHIIRGEDHISNTPRHILLQRALGFATPQYAHIPLILMPDKSKMSKRKHESAVKHFRERGILPDALLNYLALLGWNPGTEQEIFSRDELIKLFDIAQVHKSGAVFDVEKLHWFNREYLLRLSDDAFAKYALPTLEEDVRKQLGAYDEMIGHALIPLLRQTITTLDDVRTAARAGEYDFFFTTPTLDTAGKLLYKEEMSAEALEHLVYVRNVLAELLDFSAGSVKAILWDYATERGRGAVLWPLRMALTGKEKSPDPFLVSSVIGKSATLERIDTAIRLLSKTP